MYCCLFVTVFRMCVVCWVSQCWCVLCQEKEHIQEGEATLRLQYCVCCIHCVASMFCSSMVMLMHACFCVCVGDCLMCSRTWTKRASPKTSRHCLNHLHMMKQPRHNVIESDLSVMKSFICWCCLCLCYFHELHPQGYDGCPHIRTKKKAIVMLIARHGGGPMYCVHVIWDVSCRCVILSQL